MDEHQFEARVLRLWTTTRIPLTSVNLQLDTGLARPTVERWLAGLLRAGVLELESDGPGDVDDAGDVGAPRWRVCGAARSAFGPQTLAELEAYKRLEREVGPVPPSGALALRAVAAGGATPHKSLVISGVLSFFLGPLGWLYAAPLRTAVPAALAYLVACAVLPRALLIALLALSNPVSALVGLAYAWRFNQTGRRSNLLVDPAPPGLPPER